MTLRKLKWSEYEDRAAYRALPREWEGHFGSLSPLDPSPSSKNAHPDEIFGQKYEPPMPVSVVPENDQAFEATLAALREERAREMRELAERQASPDKDAMMSNFSVKNMESLPVLEYWRR